MALGTAIRKIQHITGTVSTGSSIGSSSLTGGVDFDTVTDTEKTAIANVTSTLGGASTGGGRACVIMTATNAITVYAGYGSNKTVRYAFNIIEYY